MSKIHQHFQNGLGFMQMMSQQLTQRMQDPAYREKMAVLREDPELKTVGLHINLFPFYKLQA